MSHQETTSGTEQGVGATGELRRPPRPAGGGPIVVDEGVVQRVVMEVLTDLKSERVQEELGAEVQVQLKSERVQEMLKALPEWKQVGFTLQRVSLLPTIPELFCAFVIAMTRANGVPVSLSVAPEGRVKITLRSVGVDGRCSSAVTEELVALASQIG